MPLLQLSTKIQHLIMETINPKCTGKKIHLIVGKLQRRSTTAAAPICRSKPTLATREQPTTPLRLTTILPTSPNPTSCTSTGRRPLSSSRRPAAWTSPASTDRTHHSLPTTTVCAHTASRARSHTLAQNQGPRPLRARSLTLAHDQGPRSLRTRWLTIKIIRRAIARCHAQRPDAHPIRRALAPHALHPAAQ